MTNSPVHYFNHELRHFLIGFKLFGLSPNAGNNTWKVVLLLHSLLLIAIAVLLSYSAFGWLKIFESSAGGALVSIVAELMFCGLIVTDVIILIQAIVFREESSLLEERFETIYKLFTQKLMVNVDVKRIKSRLFWKIFLIVIFLVIVMAFNIAAMDYYNVSLAYSLHSLWPIIVIRARCIHNIFLVDLITEFLNHLNGKIEEMIEGSKREQETMVIKYFQTSDFRHLIRSPYTELLILKDVYGYIWDITNLINDAYGWSLLAIATQSFIEFTCNGYWLFLAMDNKISGASAINALCTIIPVVFVLANIAYSCYCAIDSGTKTGSIIHQLEKHTRDDHNSLVREFSLQVAHEPITISANGFFNIDFSLLGSMLAATVTYLVILIQFQQSEKNRGGGVTM